MPSGLARLALILALLPLDLRAQLPRTPEKALEDHVAGTNDFGLELFRVIADPGQNVLLSPQSVAEALSMTALATDGEVHAELAGALHFPSDELELETSRRALGHLLTDGKKPASYRPANRIWLNRAEDPGYYQPSYLAAVKKNFGADPAFLDFAAGEESRRVINDWVEGRTAGLIRDLIPEHVLDASVTIVLTNAVHFKSSWARPFDPKLTRDDAFWVTADSSLPTPFLNGKVALRRATVENATWVELPYADRRFVFLAALPDKGVEIADFEKTLGAASLAAARSALRDSEEFVRIPRFKHDTTYHLRSRGLPELGLRKLFAATHDWRPLNGGRDALMVSLVEHKASIILDEEGTEAAAATAVITKRGGRPQVLALDRPFDYFILEARTGLVLFAGRFAHP